MKKQLKRAIFCAICMIVVGVMCLTGVTYAWFTKSDAAVVEGIDIQAMTAVGGILISADPHGGNAGEAWAYRLDLGIKETDFKPASTHPNTIDTNGNLAFFDAEVNEANLQQIKTTRLSSADKYYVKKDIYLNNSAGENDVIVSLKGTTVTDLDSKGLDSATRIAIVNHGSYTLGADKGASAAAAAAAVAKNAAAVQIYENNAKVHPISGSTEYIETYGVKATKQDAFFDMNDETTGAVELVNSCYEGKTGEGAKQYPEITVAAGTCQKVTVYVWIEGQDTDCQNQASGANLKIAIHFTKQS